MNARRQGHLQSNADKGTKTERPVGQALAEWVTLGISLALILAIAGFLVYQARQPEPPFIAPEVQPRFEEVRIENGSYILPVKVTNNGKRTLRDLKIESQWTPPGDGQKETVDFTIDYLGERSTQTVYFYFDDDPRTLRPEVSPVHYRLR